MGLLGGKVVFITGGARGQRRPQAAVSAREGADVVIVDIAAQVGSVGYKMATPSDLDDTVRKVQADGQRALAFTADVQRIIA